MQASLFPGMEPIRHYHHQPKAKKEKKPPRIWEAFEKFPFGPHRGKTLGHLADYAPGYLEWWQQKNKIHLSEELKIRIMNAKNLLR